MTQDIDDLIAEVDTCKRLAILGDTKPLRNWVDRAAAAMRAQRDEIARLTALLQEARESWIKVGYGASHEDVAECRDFCDRIDAVLK